MKSIFKIRIIIWALLAAVVFFLFFEAVVPGGTINYYSDLHHHSYFISQLSPAERLENSATSTIIIGEPAYFSLRTSRGFDKAKVTINYLDNSQSPVIEMGVLTDKQVWNYDLKPLQNKILDRLSGNWTTLTERGVTLFQRKIVYEAVDDFLSDLPATDKIATYNYDLKNDYKIEGYERSGSENRLEIPLRGPFQFYTYIKDENLKYDFNISDINKNKDADPVTVNVYGPDNNLVAERKLDDDGSTDDDGKITRGRSINFELRSLPEGVYKVEFKCNSDIVTDSIKSGQNIMSFVNKIWLHDSGLRDIRVYTDSRVISAETINPSKLQTISVGGQKLEVKETFKQFGIRTKKDFNEIILDNDDVLLSGDGMISFSPGSFINPAFKKINENSNVDQDNIDFVIAGYSKPENADGFKQATIEFDLTKAYRENGRYSFLISAPRLGTPSNQGGILIKDISVELTGKTLLNYLNFK